MMVTRLVDSCEVSLNSHEIFTLSLLLCFSVVAGDDKWLRRVTMVTGLDEGLSLFLLALWRITKVVFRFGIALLAAYAFNRFLVWVKESGHPSLADWMVPDWFIWSGSILTFLIVLGALRRASR
jgi:hypothetical protein